MAAAGELLEAGAEAPVVVAVTVAGAAALELAGADVAAGVLEGRVMVTPALRQNCWANWRVAVLERVMSV